MDMEVENPHDMLFLIVACSCSENFRDGNILPVNSGSARLSNLIKKKDKFSYQ